MWVGLAMLVCEVGFSDFLGLGLSCCLRRLLALPGFGWAGLAVLGFVALRAALGLAACGFWLGGLFFLAFADYCCVIVSLYWLGLWGWCSLLF